MDNFDFRTKNRVVFRINESGRGTIEEEEKRSVAMPFIVFKGAEEAVERLPIRPSAPAPPNFGDTACNAFCEEEREDECLEL